MNLTELRKGDIVRLTHTVEVTHVSPRYVEVADKKNPVLRFGFWNSDAPSTRKVEVVRKAKPAAGDVITGRELKATMWKRGTVFRTTDSIGTSVLVLDKNGDLHSSYSGNHWPIEQVATTGKFEVIHVA